MASTRSANREAGVATVEVVLMMPVLVVLLFFIVALGRLAQARADVDGAARDAARAASVERTPSAARGSAEATADATLRDRKLTCQDRRLVTSTQAFRPGGDVIVEVVCTINLSDATVSGMPGSNTLIARFVEPIDRYRSVR